MRAALPLSLFVLGALFCAAGCGGGEALDPEVPAPDAAGADAAASVPVPSGVGAVGRDGAQPPDARPADAAATTGSGAPLGAPPSGDAAPLGESPAPDASPVSDGPAADRPPAPADVRPPADAQAATPMPDAARPDTAATPPRSLAISPRTAIERLARFLWKGDPDDEILAHVAAGRPSTTEQVLQITAQMLASPRARSLPGDFVVWWLDLDRVSGTTLDVKLYPAWTPALREPLLNEARLFAEDLFSNHRGYADLLTARYTFADQQLARLYGLAGGTSAFVRVELPEERAGILTRLAPLVAGTWHSYSSPVARGLTVRERVLCQPMPSPPVGINVSLPPPQPLVTTRDRYAMHVENPACAGCHNLIDPLGFAFEHFDALGRYRQTEGGKPIDASGVETGVNPSIPFQNAADLVRGLAQHHEGRVCFARKWLEHALGRTLREGDAPSVDSVVRVAQANAWRLRAFVEGVVTAPSFLAP